MFKQINKRKQNLFCILQADKQLGFPCLTVSAKSSWENCPFYIQAKGKR